MSPHRSRTGSTRRGSDVARLLTDFDGVIAPFGAHRDDVTLVRPGGYLDSAFVLNGLPEILWGLHTSGLVTWTMLSNWGAEVVQYLEPFGIGEPHALVPGTVGGDLRRRHGKAAAVEELLGRGEAVIWCEDLEVQSFREECSDAIALLDHPRLLVIETNSEVGLTPADIRRAVAFAEKWR